MFPRENRIPLALRAPFPRENRIPLALRAPFSRENRIPLSPRATFPRENCIPLALGAVFLWLRTISASLVGRSLGLVSSHESLAAHVWRR